MWGESRLPYAHYDNTQKGSVPVVGLWAVVGFRI